MVEYQLKAYHDMRAAPVAEMTLGYSASIPEFMPKLAEEAGLGAFIKTDGNGWHSYENGQMSVEKVYDRQLTH